ncbi:hypothetical protein F53441_5021 [Fusarium austroafricanum]|uniref:Uncharacterized protein n=1 Tax=Fusarium austroafricanum TaxID=2364996 RepID=A0A8H4KM09_9HYPO|nr:hypothetical protein F53441_5021 [Fusarium austroafricanum]
MQFLLATSVALLATASQVSAWHLTAYSDVQDCNPVDTTEYQILEGDQGNCYSFGWSMPGVGCSHHYEGGFRQKPCKGQFDAVAMYAHDNTVCSYYAQDDCRGLSTDRDANTCINNHQLLGQQNGPGYFKSFKCLFLAVGGPARAVAGLELNGESQWDNGVICYTYLSTYLAPVDAETAGSDLPTALSFPTTRGIIPPDPSNRSTSVPPSALTEPTDIDGKPTTGIDTSASGIDTAASGINTFSSGISILPSSGLTILTDDQDSGTTATESGSLFPPTSVTSIEASTTSSGAVSGQAVILFVSPQAGDEKRDLVKRAPGGFIGGDITNVEICTYAATFRLIAGQLLDSQNPIYYNGEPFKEFRGRGAPPEDAITRQFADVAGTLVFASRALPNINAGFCQEPESGQVYVTFTSSPPGCVSISLRVYSVERCQDGEIVGVDPPESVTTKPNQSSTIAEPTNTTSTETVISPDGSSSTTLAGLSVSTEISQSSDSSETIETTQSLETTKASCSSATDGTTTAAS